MATPRSASRRSKRPAPADRRTSASSGAGALVRAMKAAARRRLRALMRAQYRGIRTPRCPVRRSDGGAICSTSTRLRAPAAHEDPRRRLPARDQHLRAARPTGTLQRRRLFPALVRGAAMLDNMRRVNIPIGGFIAAAKSAAGSSCRQLVRGDPVGARHEDAFERIAARSSPTSTPAGFDAVYLDLHGAAVADARRGHRRRAARAHPRRRRPERPDRRQPRPPRQRHAAHARRGRRDGLVPQLSARRHGGDRRAGGGVAGAPVRLGKREPLAYRRLPFLIPLNAQSTWMEPARGLYEELVELDEISAPCRASAWRFPPPTSTSARRWSGRTARVPRPRCSASTRALPSRRNGGRLLDAPEAVRRAVALAAQRTSPVVLADTQDNPGAGGDSNTTGLLRALLQQGAGRAYPGRVALGLMFDPGAAERAFTAGVGATVCLSLGRAVPFHRRSQRCAGAGRVQGARRERRPGHAEGTDDDRPHGRARAVRLRRDRGHAGRRHERQEAAARPRAVPLRRPRARVDEDPRRSRAPTTFAPTSRRSPPRSSSPRPPGRWPRTRPICLGRNCRLRPGPDHDPRLLHAPRARAIALRNLRAPRPLLPDDMPRRARQRSRRRRPADRRGPHRRHRARAAHAGRARPRPRCLDGAARHGRLPHPSRQGPHLAAPAEPDRRRARRLARDAGWTATRDWIAEDVRRRMEFGLATAYAKGVVAIRTHLDSLAPQASISFPVFREVRERWAGRIDLQVSSIAPLDIFLGDEGRQLADIVAESGGRLGAVTRFAEASRRADAARARRRDRARVFALAAERGLDLDLHVDESTDPRSQHADAASPAQRSPAGLRRPHPVRPLHRAGAADRRVHPADDPTPARTRASISSACRPSTCTCRTAAPSRARRAGAA